MKKVHLMIHNHMRSINNPRCLPINVYFVDKITMKFMNYSIILVFLILQIGIKAEPPAVSFINIISNIIAHAQFVQDNIINSSIAFNQTLPWINQDLALNANGSNCSQDIQLFIRDLTVGKTWALKSKSCFSLLE